MKCKRIDWDAVQALMPARTRTQLKSYFTNFLKYQHNIQNSTSRLKNGDLLDFVVKSMECGNDWTLLSNDHFPDFSAKCLKQKYERLLEYKIEFFACYAQLIKYPNTKFEFNKKLLRMIQENIPNLMKLRHGTFEDGSAQKEL